MYASETGHDEAFPIVTPRGCSVSFPTQGTIVTYVSTLFYDWYTQNALDGLTIDFNPDFIQPSSSCSSTTAQTNPWWRVDLRYIYRVSRVVITNRLDCCPEQIDGAEIRIGNSLENNGNNNPICAVISTIPSGATANFSCGGIEGRYVIVHIPGDVKTLSLCEAEVYGHLIGKLML
uniref:Fucolectin tachylectin-4 pentraxin-1 domain-containing protein n=1 Tax=Sinocyclocheilus grahami TaxID=75366 RepID=A0A672KV66_SINGR